MKPAILKRAGIFSLFLIPFSLQAANNYVTDSFNVGLHEERTLDSPIIKVVPSGTRLELIKREDNLSYVKEPGGATGWIDNSYLQDEAPAGGQAALLRTRNLSLEKQIQELQKRIENLSDPNDNNVLSELQRDYAALQQDFKTERLKAGELQAQLAELRKRIGQDNDNESLYRQITQLEEEKKNLEVLLANALDPDNSKSDVLSANMVSGNHVSSGWKQLLPYLAIALLCGLIVGVYIMDYLNRRRHGGFRV